MQAQSRRNLCVWYSIHKTEQPFIFEIEGQVQDIEKSAHATEVLVLEDPLAGDDGIVGYQLDDNLVRSSMLEIIMIWHRLRHLNPNSAIRKTAEFRQPAHVSASCLWMLPGLPDCRGAWASISPQLLLQQTPINSSMHTGMFCCGNGERQL